MGNRCYELKNEPWDRVRYLIPKSRMGRPRKDDHLIRNTILWLARSGAGEQISRHGMDQRYTVGFVNGMMREAFCAYLRP